MLRCRWGCDNIFIQNGVFFGMKLYVVLKRFWEDGFGPFHPATLLPLEFFLADKTIPGGLVGGQYMTVLYIISSLIS